MYWAIKSRRQKFKNLPAHGITHKGDMAIKSIVGDTEDKLEKNQIILLTPGFLIDDNAMDEYQKHQFLKKLGWSESRLLTSLTLFILMQSKKETDIPKSIIGRTKVNRYFFHAVNGNLLRDAEYEEDYLPVMAETII
jgi:hypothetical protein